MVLFKTCGALVENGMKKKPITTSRYDLKGHGIHRVWEQQVIEKVLPFGHFGGGAHVLWVLRLMVIHTVGRAVAWLVVRRGSWRGGR